jgi:integrase
LFYQYFQKLNGKSRKTLTSLGRFKESPRSAGISLQDARTKVLEFENLLRSGKDPKACIAEREIEEQERARKILQQKSHGTFNDLLDSYLAKMEGDGKRSVQQVARSLKTYVRKPFPELLSVKANKIDTDDIRRIISRMIANGVTTHSNRVHSYLHAAFANGLKADNDPRRHTEEQVFFHLKSNPVSAIGKQTGYERRGEHVIAEKELKIIWNELPKKNLVAGMAIRLALCTGQRVGELVRIKWSDIDIDDCKLTIPKTVSKNNLEHEVPLDKLAWSVIMEMRDFTGDYCEYVFAARNAHRFIKDKHACISSIGGFIRELCNENSEIEKFVPRDTRRTWKTLTGQIGITKWVRDICQNHAQKIDVSGRHYDMCDYLPEKRQAMRVWDNYLTTIINPNENIIHFKRA